MPTLSSTRAAAMMLIFGFVICGILKVARSQPPQQNDEKQIRNSRSALLPSLRDRATRPDGDLGAMLRSDRRLTLEEMQLIAELSDDLMKGKSHRLSEMSNVMCLGYLGHRMCLPVLVAILRDGHDDSSIRALCAKALQGINDRRIVDILIEQLHEDDPNLWTHMQFVLKDIKGTPDNPRPKIIHFPKNEEGRLAYQELWRNWWGEAFADVSEPRATPPGRAGFLAHFGSRGFMGPIPQDGE